MAGIWDRLLNLTPDPNQRGISAHMIKDVLLLHHLGDITPEIAREHLQISDPPNAEWTDVLALGTKFTTLPSNDARNLYLMRLEATTSILKARVERGFMTSAVAEALWRTNLL